MLSNYHNFIDIEKEFERIKQKMPYNVKHLKLIIKDGCYNNLGSKLNQNPKSCSGAWTKDGKIIISTPQQLLKVMEYYNVKLPYKKFLKLCIGNEIGHYIWNNILTDSEKENYKNLLTNFKTPYTIRKNNPEERFSEYIAYQLI